MPSALPSTSASDELAHPRWARTRESGDFFIDEDRLRLLFYALAAAAAVLLGLLGTGLWRLQRAALSPPVLVGVAEGRVFTGEPQPIESLRDDDFDPQLRETVEVLFSRTEKGLPPAIAEFVAPDVLSAVERDYRDAAAKYPAGYAQTLAIVEARPEAGRTGWRRVRYRGLLSSRSLAAAQTSPVYLDCLFAAGRPSAANAAGWRLVRLAAVGREEFYRDERERAVRKELGLP